MRRPRHCNRAFTMVELLVVISVLGLLMGLLLPALGSAHRKGLKNRELNALKQVGIGWQLYSSDNKEQVLPGYLETKVQEHWNVNFLYPNRERIPPAPSFSMSQPNIAGPWTWRIMQYLNNVHDMIHGHLDEPDYDATTVVTDEAEVIRIAEEPGFGYNAMRVGGWWRMIQTGNGLIPSVEDQNGDGQVDATEQDTGRLVVRSVASIRRSSELVIFCSSSLLEPGLYRSFPPDQKGCHYVMPPWLGSADQWSVPGAGGGLVSAPNAQVDSVTHGGGADPSSIRVLIETAAPIGRYNRLVATLYADLHNDANQPGSLYDARKWIDAATKSNSYHN